MTKAMTSECWMMMLNRCNRRALILAVCLVTSLGCVHVAADDTSQQQRADVGVSLRTRRDATNFWKRVPLPDAGDRLASFWKRAHPHNTLDSFWKRRLPAVAGTQAFWKRWMQSVSGDGDLAVPMFPGSEEKKNVRDPHSQQHRRAKEMSARRPEFNPTGW